MEGSRELVSHDESPWLSPRTVAEVELNTTLLAEVLREYRKEHGINQADLAQILNFDQSYVSKIETGQRHVRDIEMLLRIAQQLDITPNRLGISDELLRPVAPPSTSALVGAEDPVKHSQAEWCATRRHLNRNRGSLARMAANLYRADVRLGKVPLMARRDWIPRQPIRLEDIEIEWTDDTAGALVSGGEPEATAMLPLRAPGQRYTRYTSAIRYLDRPSLFENRPSYRLLDVDLIGPSGRMRFGLGTYFDKLDVSEAVAHEIARADELNPGKAPSWSALPLRALIGDPFDLQRRFVMPAIETLTLRRDRKTGRATFLLHWRDPAKVATAAGIYGLIPAGEFQPSSIASWDRKNDFDLWRNMVREYSEEILGEPERDGSSGEPLDYDNWPLYRTLRTAQQQGRVSVYCLGVGLDTLTLTATILTVAVFDDDVFDDLFGQAVQVNPEGVLITSAEASKVSEGLPFTADTVRRLLEDEPMASPGACILDRAWRFRDVILSGQR
jgi:transcriptional regulator with XRE-family HTH domain